MKKVGGELGRWKAKIGSFDRDRQLDSLLSRPVMRSFVVQHPELTRKDYLRSLLPLRQYVQEREHCAACPGLDQCPNMMQGYQPDLIFYNGLLDLQLKPCHQLLSYQEQKRIRELIQSHYIPKDILEGTFEEIDIDPERSAAIEAAIQYCYAFSEGKPSKGLYLYGNLGVGKSRIAGAIARELVHYGVDSIMVYVPDFMREIKDAIREGAVNDKLDALKTASVLILDDIGAESLSPWVRDEVLGAILQYRVAEGLTTVYTSNLALDELEDHLSHSNKGGIERMKAKRIMERIRYYVDIYLVEGPNRRKLI